MKKKIGFIGAGNMGSAIMKGISKSEINEEAELYASDLDSAKIEALSEYGVIKCDDACSLCDKCDIIFLSVKPQGLEDVLKSIKDHIREDHILVSIAAGISAEYVRETLSCKNTGIVLVMPNTPLLVGEGASAVAKTDSIDQKQFEFVCRIFESSGKAQVIDENKMKEIIAINGSSPAFIYLYAKGFIDYAVKNGIDEQAAKILFSQSLVGSAKMITESEFTIDELIKMVSSPGGTTLAGLNKLYSNDILKAVDEACEACTKRAYELSK